MNHTIATRKVCYEFDRYRHGQRMAEGARVHAASKTEALTKARNLFPECPDDDFRLSTPNQGDTK